MERLWIGWLVDVRRKIYVKPLPCGGKGDGGYEVGEN